MHIETLKVFCDIIESGSFSYAASQNFVTQSAVSQQVRSLEDKYDCRLLERARAGVKPTPAGQILYNSSKEIVRRFLELENRLREIGSVIAGSIRVGTVYSVGLHELPPYLTEFLRNYSARQRPSRVSALEQDLRRLGRGQDRSRRRCLSDQTQPDRHDRRFATTSWSWWCRRTIALAKHEPGKRQRNWRADASSVTSAISRRARRPTGSCASTASSRTTRWSSTISRRSSARSRSATDARSSAR